MDRVRVLVVDDDIRFRWAVMEALVAEESLEIVDEASDGNEAVEKARALKPHVALMDLYMPNCNGLEATRQLQAEAPDTHVLMFTVSEAEADLVSDANLVLSPPLEPTLVLGLHQWLREVANGDVRKITASWGGETVMSVSLREPVPLLRMLAGFPSVRAVTEEPYAGDRTKFADGLASPEEQKIGVQRHPPKQFRLALKAG